MQALLILALLSLPATDGASTAELLMKVVSYDRNLGARTPQGLRLLILHHPDAAGSRDDALEFQREVAALSNGRSLLAPDASEILSFSSEAKLASTLVEKKISALYVASGFGASLPAIVRVAQDAGVFTLAGAAEDVELGLVAGVASRGGAKKVVVNMGAAEKVGVDLDAVVRQVAERVGGAEIEPERSSLRDALIRYRNAIQEKDLNSLRTLWPALGDAEATKVEASMAAVRSQQVFLALLGIAHDGPRVRVRVRRADRVVTRQGETLISGRLVEIVFSRGSGGEWVIDSMGSV